MEKEGAVAPQSGVQVGTSPCLLASIFGIAAFSLKSTAIWKFVSLAHVYLMETGLLKRCNNPFLAPFSLPVESLPGFRVSRMVAAWVSHGLVWVWLTY